MATHWKILENLYVSALPQLRDCRRYDTTAICSTVPNAPQEVIDYVPAYLSAPMHDGKKIPTNLEVAVDWTLACLVAGRRTLVHCKAGRNRSVLVAGIVAARLTGMRGDHLIEYLRWARPNSLHNPVFEQYLREME